MSFPKDFLTVLANEKELTSKEMEVFLALFGDDKSRVQITQELAILAPISLITHNPALK